MKVIGLRTATPEEIQALIKKYRAQGYRVSHVQHNMPFNGILRIE